MTDILLTRRKLIGGIGLVLAAPFVVKAASLMPVRQPKFMRLTDWSAYLNEDPWRRIMIDMLTETNMILADMAYEEDGAIHAKLTQRDWTRLAVSGVGTNI